MPVYLNIHDSLHPIYSAGEVVESTVIEFEEE